VVLAATLACLTWYATLLPFWAVQSGQKGAQVFYSQGMGLWLNYTEHVGDPTFDPGNSLWIPPQSSGVHTYASQWYVSLSLSPILLPAHWTDPTRFLYSQDQRAFCKDAIGDLHIQYCEVMKSYCGPATRILQFAMAVLSASALLGVVWSVLLVVTPRRTIVDRWLMNLCIFNGVGYLVIATVWYLTFFRVVLSTTFYKDQYNRCGENPTNRSCWHIGTCVYLIVACAVLYPMLSVVVATYETAKFKAFRQRLRVILDMTTAVDLPLDHSPLSTRSEKVQRGGQESPTKKRKLNSRGGTELDAKDTSRSLQPLHSQPSAVSSIDVHQIEGISVRSDDEEEKERDDAVKYGASREFVVESPRRKGSLDSLDSPPSSAAAEPKRSSSPRRSERKTMKNVKSIEF
jgi:hypothetical protein